jgi:iron complex transport system ATP-binding protein
MIEMKKIKAGYSAEPVLREITGEINEADFCMIIGPNGAGKSTLLKTILGFLPLMDGDISIRGRSLQLWQNKELAKLISYIPQELTMQFDYPIYEMVLMGRFPYLGYWQTYSAKDREYCEQALYKMDLNQMKDKMYSQLSGGEKQRVAVARALAQQAQVLLMDEAFSHLDLNHQMELMKILKQINKEEKKTVVVVSHNVNLAAEYSQRVIMIKNGNILADGSPEEVITAENLSKLYNAKMQIVKNPISGKPNFVYS